MKNVKRQPTTIRQATIEDVETIVRFNQTLATESEDIVLDTRRVRCGVKALLKNPERGFYLLAERNGGAVGQLMITYEWSDWRNGMFWWIQSVYVAQNHRKTGVVRSLFRRVQQLAAREKVCGFRLYVDKQNRIAQAAYRALGMSKANYDFYQIDRVLAHAKTKRRRRSH